MALLFIFYLFNECSLSSYSLFLRKNGEVCFHNPSSDSSSVTEYSRIHWRSFLDDRDSEEGQTKTQMSMNLLKTFKLYVQ